MSGLITSCRCHLLVEIWFTEHKISRITDSYGITKYLGRKYANNEVVLEPGWIREKFEFSEPEFYKQVTTVTCDEKQHKAYIVTVGRCALHTSQDERNSGTSI